MFESLRSVDPAVSKELWRYLITVAVVVGGMSLLVYKTATTKWCESLRKRLILGRSERRG